jgi:glycosyltransferase involved in cell wall biosynthesis
MDVVVALEHRFSRTPDGAVWTQAMFAYPFWQRYLEVFDRVRFAARVEDVSSVPDTWKRANGDQVDVAAIPHYVGPKQYLMKASQVKQAAQQAIGNHDAVILRVGSQIANCMRPKLLKTLHPYAVEVVADPYDVFAPGAVRHPLRPFFRWRSPRNLRQFCKEACAAAYVTEFALQRRYPPTAEAYSSYYSDVELSDAIFTAAPRTFEHTDRPITLVFVGTLAQLYKAPEVLVEAVGNCSRENLNLKLVMIGDGKHRSELEAQAIRLGIGDRVRFCGQLSAGQAVRDELNQADLFVLPSRQEGLPRAMVEAMAQGLPCIGSLIGGVPELLPPEDLVQPGDITGLTQKIREIVLDRNRMAQMSARNLEKARKYKESALRERRIAFYQYVRTATENWLSTHS